MRSCARTGSSGKTRLSVNGILCPDVKYSGEGRESYLKFEKVALSSRCDLHKHNLQMTQGSVLYTLGDEKDALL